jgi:hypothetical protein
MSDTDYLALGRQFLGALGAQDWGAVRALVSPDVTWSFPGDARISGIAEGVDAVVAKGTAITSSGVRIELLNVLAGMDGAAVSLSGGHIRPAKVATGYPMVPSPNRRTA